MKRKIYVLIGCDEKSNDLAKLGEYRNEREIQDAMMMAGYPNYRVIDKTIEETSDRTKRIKANRERAEKNREWWDRPGWKKPYPGAWIETALWLHPVLCIRRIDGQIWEVMTPKGNKDIVVEEQILKVYGEDYGK